MRNCSSRGLCVFTAVLAITGCVIPASLWAATQGLRSEVARIGQLADGTLVDQYTLTNDRGLRVSVMTYGATLRSVEVPDRNGKIENVTLSLDTLEEYIAGHPLFGSTVGRFANRIAGGRFTLDGIEYRLFTGGSKNHIHGGKVGFHKVVWKADVVHDEESVGVTLSHTSPDGHEGYPGTLSVTVTYRLTAANELRIEYEAKTDKVTHVNLTNHAYWNLAGAGSGDVLGHVVQLHADRYLPADDTLIPTGDLRSVTGTPLDFTRPMTIGSRIKQLGIGGYDHCYVINSKSNRMSSERKPVLAARVVEPDSGRVMEILTTQPGVQVYTANGLGRRFKTRGRPYGPYHGVCFETQHFPDSPNQPTFPTTILRPNEVFREVTVHRFSLQ